MSLRELDEFYLRQPEPNRSCFMALKEILAHCHPAISEEWKYKLPFFYLHGKMFCYLWQDKKTTEPYIGFFDGNKLEHPMLIQGDRKRMKVLPINPNEDIPIAVMEEVLEEALEVALKRINP